MIRQHANALFVYRCRYLQLSFHGNRTAAASVASILHYYYYYYYVYCLIKLLHELVCNYVCALTYRAFVDRKTVARHSQRPSHVYGDLFASHVSGSR